MRLSEAVSLLDHASFRGILSRESMRWADLGCGTGLFTEALAHFLPRGSSIYGVDLQPRLRADLVNGVSLIPVQSDFVSIPLHSSLPEKMDGFLMANAFHYVREKTDFLSRLRTQYKHPESAMPLLMIEYDTDRPVEKWVPWPVSYSSLQLLLGQAGWSRVEQLGVLPSIYGGGNMYAALALASIVS